MSDLLELIAMTPAGDVFIVRDPYGRCWLYSPFDEQQTRLDSDGDVDQAISMGDLELIEQTFSSYSELSTFIDDRSALVDIPERSTDPVTSVAHVELMLAGALDWKSDGTAKGLEIAHKTITRLLESRPVQQDHRLRKRLQAELNALHAQFDTSDLTDAQREARQRFAMAA